MLIRNSVLTPSPHWTNRGFEMVEKPARGCDSCVSHSNLFCCVKVSFHFHRTKCGFEIDYSGLSSMFLVATRNILGEWVWTNQIGSLCFFRALKRLFQSLDFPQLKPWLCRNAAPIRDSIRYDGTWIGNDFTEGSLQMEGREIGGYAICLVLHILLAGNVCRGPFHYSTGNS